MIRFLLIAGIFVVADILEFKKSKEWKDMAVYIIFMAAVLVAGGRYAI